MLDRSLSIRPMAKGALAALAVTLALGTTSALALPTTPVVSGNITFNNFVCLSPGGCDGLAVAPYVSVSPPDPVAGEYGIQITGFLFALAGQSTDFSFRYDAHISGATFTDASLYYNGTAISSVNERIFNIDTTDLIGSLDAHNPPLHLSDHIDLLENATNIRVEKDIGLHGPAGSLAHISIIDQTFSQVPEPASLALLGAGLVGMGLFRRRRNAV